MQTLKETKFADIVKIMMEDVSTDEIIVDRITKTKKGNVEIRIKGKEGKCRLEFKDQLNTKLTYKKNKSTK